MIQRYSIAPPNALILLMDSNGGEIPETMGGAAIAATESCVAVRTRNPIDGETEVVLADVPLLAGWTGSPAFDGVLEVSSRRIALTTAYGEPLASIDAPRPSVRVRIWTDDADEPSSIWIAIAGWADEGCWLRTGATGFAELDTAKPLHTCPRERGHGTWDR